MSGTRLIPTLLRWLFQGAAMLACAAALGAENPGGYPPGETITHFLVRSYIVETPEGTLPAGRSEDPVPADVWSRKQAEQKWSSLRMRSDVALSACPSCRFRSTLTGRFFAGGSRLGREVALPPGSAVAKKFVGFNFRIAARAVGDGIDVELSGQYVRPKEDVAGTNGSPSFDERTFKVTASVDDVSTIVVALGRAPQAGRELHALVEISKIAPEFMIDAFLQSSPALPLPANANGSPSVPAYGASIRVAETKTPALRKADHLVLPKVDLHEASVADAVAYLESQAILNDPEKTGVPIRVESGAARDTRITLSLSHLSLTEALAYVAGLASLEVNTEANALVLQLPKPSEPKKP